jgi:signal transduction histidine kinase
MKYDIPVPLDRLYWFKAQLGLDGESLETVHRHRDAFIRKKEEFSETIFGYFNDIPQTRFILQKRASSGHLKTWWTQWFASLFQEDFNRKFLTYLWRSGLRHVEAEVDQRFINLGFSMVRRFCQGITKAEIPPADQQNVLIDIDRMLDLCLLVETQAFITATARCDIEVVRGLSHQVRNPLTVIGGNVLRLKKNVGRDNPAHRAYEIILDESRRLENMVNDVERYSEFFEKEPKLSIIVLETVIQSAIQELQSAHRHGNHDIDLHLDPDFPVILGDSDDLERMFYYVLQHGLGTGDADKPVIRITSSQKDASPEILDVEIFHAGRPPDREEMDNLFVPFYSSKPHATGFGLAIARLAARRSLGDLYLEPRSDSGTRFVIKLLIPTEKS